MTDSVDYLIARLGDEATCMRRGSYIEIQRWLSNNFDPPLRLYLTASQLDRAIPEFAEAAIGAWSNTDKPSIDDGWKLLIADLDERIGKEGHRNNEIRPLW